MAKRPNIFFRVFSVVTVSFYMLGVMLYLLRRKRIRGPIGLRHLIRSYFQQPYQGELLIFRPDSGFCYTSPLPGHLISDREGHSKIVVFENGKPLMRAHAGHDEIRMVGNGSFSHWGTEVFLSTSDNSDPTTNGKKYSVMEVRDENV